MIAGAERVALGIDEGQHAFALIIVQRLPGIGQRHDDANNTRDEIDPADTGEE
jgi:hypothetical protein